MNYWRFLHSFQITLLIITVNAVEFNAPLKTLSPRLRRQRDIAAPAATLIARANAPVQKALSGSICGYASADGANAISCDSGYDCLQFNSIVACCSAQVCASQWVTCIGASATKTLSSASLNNDNTLFCTSGKNTVCGFYDFVDLDDARAWSCDSTSWSEKVFSKATKNVPATTTATHTTSTNQTTSANITSTSPFTTTTSPILNPQPSDGSTPSGGSTNVGAIVGGVIGGLIGVGAILVIIFFGIYRPKKAQKTTTAAVQGKKNETEDSENGLYQKPELDGNGVPIGSGQTELDPQRDGLPNIQSPQELPVDGSMFRSDVFHELDATRTSIPRPQQGHDAV